MFKVPGSAPKRAASNVKVPGKRRLKCEEECVSAGLEILESDNKSSEFG